MTHIPNPRVFCQLRLIALGALACLTTGGIYLPAAVAQDQASFSLGRPEVSGNEATYPVTLDFSVDANEELVFFSLDAASSAGELTADGTDFSAFSFTPSSPLLDDFEMIPGAEFGAGPLFSTVQFDSITASLSPGRYALGDLHVDFSGSGLLPGDRGAVSLAADDSVIGVESPGESATFRFIDADFQIGTATQPIDLIVADESDFSLTVSAGEEASASVPGSPVNILGGIRDVQLLFGEGSGAGVLTAAKADGEDVLALESSGAAIPKLQLDYGKNEELNSNFFGNGPDPFNGVLVDLALIDGTGELTVTLESDGVSNSYSKQVGAQSEIWFTFVNFPDVDLMNVDTVTVVLEGSEPESDFAIREIVLGIIPEPGTTYLIFAALAGLNLLVYRQR